MEAFRVAVCKIELLKAIKKLTPCLQGQIANFEQEKGGRTKKQTFDSTFFLLFYPSIHQFDWCLSFAQAEKG